MSGGEFWARVERKTQVRCRGGGQCPHSCLPAHIRYIFLKYILYFFCYIWREGGKPAGTNGTADRRSVNRDTPTSLLRYNRTREPHPAVRVRVCAEFGYGVGKPDPAGYIRVLNPTLQRRGWVR